MKKIMTLMLMGMLLTLTAASCKSTEKANCDAYSSVDKVETSDLASK